jgi:DNA-binding transcriptional MerR regulator
MEAIDIREVARRTGLTSRALRFYEARGLVRPARTFKGARLYGPRELERLARVIALKRAGFPLARIGEMLDRPGLDLGSMVAAQLEALTAERARLEAAEQALRRAQAALRRGEAVDAATLCEVIRQGATTMDTTGWQKVYDRYYTPDEQAHWRAKKLAAFADFDQEACARQWSELAARIEAALPLDPASPRAAAFVAEWDALLAPFTAVADASMMRQAEALYDRMDEWSGDATPPFSKRVWEFIKAAGQRASPVPAGA